MALALGTVSTRALASGIVSASASASGKKEALASGIASASGVRDSVSKVVSGKGARGGAVMQQGNWRQRGHRRRLGRQKQWQRQTVTADGAERRLGVAGATAVGGRSRGQSMSTREVNGSYGGDVGGFGFLETRCRHQ